MAIKSLEEYVSYCMNDQLIMILGENTSLNYPKWIQPLMDLNRGDTLQLRFGILFRNHFRAAALHELRFVFSIIIHKISSELLNYDARIVSENVNAIKQIIVEPANEPSKNFCIRIICLINIDLYFARYYYYQSQTS